MKSSPNLAQAGRARLTAPGIPGSIRDVAVKVLPPQLAMDEAARSRLRREANAIAALPRR